jgi:hypothetical protein
MLYQGGMPGEYMVQEEKEVVLDSMLKRPEVQRLMPRGTVLRWGAEPVSRGAVAYRPLYAEALGKAEKVQGQGYLVVTLPYLAAMKMAARRPKDHLDLEEILMSGVLAAKPARAATGLPP